MEAGRAAQPEQRATQDQQRLLHALQEAEQQARRRLECLQEVVFEVHRDGRIGFLNPAWSELLGYSVADCLGEPLRDFCHEEDAGALSAASSPERPLRFRRADGQLCWLQVRLGADEGDGVLTGSLLDVTALLEAEAQAERERMFLSTVLDNLKADVYACDADGRHMLSSRGGQAEFLPMDQWIERYHLFRADGRTPFPREDLPLARALRGERVDGVEVVAVGTSGPRHLTVTARQMTDPAGVVLGALAVATDVTDQREAQTRLAHLRSHDALTGLPNRDAFLDTLDTTITAGSGGAVLLVDLDDFGSVNDRLGGQAGDHLLREVAARLASVVPAAGHVARVAPDAFALLLDQAGDAGAASSVAADVAAALAVPVDLGGESVSVTASIGAALLEAAGGSPGAVLAAAEAAQQRARRDGLGSYLMFAPSMRTESRARVEYEAALQHAIDQQQFRLVYQPKVSLDNHRLTGVEALLRWDHPERGTVPPGEFISVAEQTGLIVPIGVWVLEESFRQAAQWRAAFPDQPPMEMHVNVSARQFDRSLATTVGSCLEASGIEPSTVWLEVTESMVMADVEAAVEILRSLKSLGVNITVDDFGTGYSSLAYLRRLPLDGLKIDRSFVDGLGRDAGDNAIVAAIVAMAHALELLVVAEGIETAEQLSALGNLGCESGQGYYYSRPQPPEYIADLLAAAAHAGAPHVTLQPSDTAVLPRTDVVLVVDDAADVRQLAGMSLATGGFDVHQASNGAEALAVARRLRPDCVVLDVHMPGLTGFEVCRALRADPQTAGCTILMLTGTGHAADKVEAFSAGADDYMVKPFAPRDLLARTRDALRRRRENG